MTTAADVLVDGQNVDKVQLRAVMTGYESSIDALLANVLQRGQDIINIDSLLIGLQTQITARTADITAIETNVASSQTQLGQQAATLNSVQTAVASFEASLAAALAAFESLSAIITAQDASGMGPIGPVAYPGLNLFGATFASDNPFGSGQSMSAGYAETYGSPITAATFAVSARVKTTGTGASQIAVGQSGLFWIGCDPAGHATAYFGTGGTPGQPPASYVNIATTVSIVDGAWHTLELDLTGSGAILFVDGVAVGTSDLVGHFYSANPFGIRAEGGDRNTAPWSGKIAEVAIWGAAAKHTTNYTLATAPFTGAEGMTALFHLSGSGQNTMTLTLPIGTRPAVASGVRFFLAAGDSVTYTVQPVGAAAEAAASNQVTISGSATPEHYEPFTANLMLFVSAISGAPLFRWLALPIIGQGGDDPSNLAGTSTTTADATPTVIATVLLTDPGIAANIFGFVLARNTATGDAISYAVSAVARNIDTANATIDPPSITAFNPPAGLAACTLTLGIFGSTITLTAVGLAGTPIVWRPNLQTTVI